MIKIFGKRKERKERDEEEITKSGLTKKFEEGISKFYPYLLKNGKDSFPINIGYEFIDWYFKENKNFLEVNNKLNGGYPEVVREVIESACKIVDEHKNKYVQERSILNKFDTSFEKGFYERCIIGEIYKNNLFQATEFCYTQAFEPGLIYFIPNEFIPAAAELKTKELSIPHAGLFWIPSPLIEKSKEKGFTSVHDYIKHNVKEKIPEYAKKYIISSALDEEEIKNKIYNHLETFALEWNPDKK